MSDDKREPVGLPGNEIVGQFTDQIRVTIAGAVADAVADVVQRFARWCIATIILTMLGSAAVTWLVGSFNHHATQVTFRHGDAVEVCARSDTPTGPLFNCRPVLK